MEWDVVIVGSGFGGSVSALRMAEKGYRVLVVEQGRHVSQDDLAAAGEDPKRLLRMPALGLRQGFFAQEVYRHVSLVRGIAVGGGSVVWAAVMLEPKQAFYDDPAWSRLPRRDWRHELAPHYATASRMLGLTSNPRQTQQDQWLRETARELGVEDSYGSVTQAIFFGDAEREQADPFFGGAGPSRRGCTFARVVPPAARRAPRTRWTRIICIWRRALARRSWLNAGFNASRRWVALLGLSPGIDASLGCQRVPPQTLTASKVIVAAGVVGTLELLLACRDRYRTLPNLSPALRAARTHQQREHSAGDRTRSTTDVSDGATISAISTSAPRT
ncbi:MAG: GMC family oxidoreductase [Rhodoferax sp.]|nr:GMC family oxidoreductase [Rhodoferax sp.]